MPGEGQPLGPSRWHLPIPLPGRNRPAPPAPSPSNKHLHLAEVTEVRARLWFLGAGSRRGFGDCQACGLGVGPHQALRSTVELPGSPHLPSCPCLASPGAKKVV